jgi:hypothetical protein
MAFRDEDREKLTEVHTLVKGHISLIRDHENRLRKQEQRMNTIHAWLVLVPFGAAIAWDWMKHKLGM